jgi:hypothetical protein
MVGAVGNHHESAIQDVEPTVLNVENGKAFLYGDRTRRRQQIGHGD